MNDAMVRMYGLRIETGIIRQAGSDYYDDPADRE